MALSSDLISFEARISNVLKRATEAGLDDELRSSMARYACVLTSGYLEESVRIVLGTWCKNKSHPHVNAYVVRQLDWFLNPKLGKILELLTHFSAEWHDAFSNLLTDEERDAINSVVSNRHQIAHGRNVGITPEPMGRYFKACKSAVRKLDIAVNGQADGLNPPAGLVGADSR